MCSMAKYRPQNNMNAPHAVHPRAIRHHGLFGISYVKEHMMIDDRWTVNSMNDQFQGMTDLLERRMTFKRLEAQTERKVNHNNFRKLKRLCRDGRTKLYLMLQGENKKKVRNFLINHKELQRLYQSMPLHMVVDNINQRTFVMRKERDRLRFRRNQLEKEYHMKLLCKAELENRIKYENEFVLEAEVKARNVRKEIENSNVRLKAVKTINVTYKKIIQILQHDQIFFESIWTSLSKDIDDQAAFIKYILYLGTPAIKSFKTLSEQYRIMENKSRITLSNNNSSSNTGKTIIAARELMEQKEEDIESVAISSDAVHHYVRETGSMKIMKNELNAIESTIKHVKSFTLCSRANEILPRMRSQVANNLRLRKMIENDILSHQALVSKLKRADLMHGVLVNNISEEETSRLKRIKELKEVLVLEDEFETKTIKYIKDRADVYVSIRISLWNMYELLRHVGKPSRIFHPTYPNSYLKLPLLKFEMLTMRACPPESFEENFDSLMDVVRRKVHKLMKAYKSELSKDELRHNRDEYHNVFLECLEVDEEDENAKAEAQLQQPKQEEHDFLQENKLIQHVPSRKHIKALSAKIVEEFSKKEKDDT